jgi:hypothetical protein
MVMKNEKFAVTEELVGKYLNRVLWSDVDPIGKIVGIKGKTKVIVQPVKAGPNKAKMEYVTGGFAGHCTNMYDQHYDFIEEGDTFVMPLSNSSMKKRFICIHNHPQKHYDFNF